MTIIFKVGSALRVPSWPIDIGTRHEPGAVLTDAELERAHIDQRGGFHFVHSSQPEAAHAASEFDSDPDAPREPMSEADKVALLIIALVSVAAVGGTIIKLWSRWFA